jgi:hypothetical protein
MVERDLDSDKTPIQVVPGPSSGSAGPPSDAAPSGEAPPRELARASKPPPLIITLAELAPIRTAPTDTPSAAPAMGAPAPIATAPPAETPPATSPADGSLAPAVSPTTTELAPAGPPAVSLAIAAEPPASAAAPPLAPVIPLGTAPAVTAPDGAGESPSTVASSAHTVTQLGARVLVLVVVFFTAVWPNLPFTTHTKWIITGISFAVLAAGSIAAFILIRARTVEFFQSLRDAIAVIAIAGGAAVAALVFVTPARDEVFKLFVVFYFSLLPAFLYLQFMAIRGPTLWEEYTENLYRLRIDDPASLPPPPRHSRYRSIWLVARRFPRFPDATKTLYQKKFEGVFGAVRIDDNPHRVLSTEKLAPITMATLLFSVAWVIVVMPTPLLDLTLFGTTPGATESPTLPIETMRFGFLGAYFYAVQMLVRRYFQNDLKASAYVNATMRIIVVALLTWTVDLTLTDEPQAYRSALAFVIGVFPDVGWKALQAVVKLPLRALVRSLRQPYPLSDLDGLNVWYEARLLEEGIEDMQNLATSNLVDVMLNTRIPVERLVDWIDQSILYLHLGKPAEEGGEGPREQLRRYGIRSATDLEDAFLAATDAGDEAGRIAKLERLLTASGEDPSVLRTILATLRREPNLTHVRAWRGAEQAERKQAA